MCFLMIDKKSLKFWDNQKNLINWHKKPKKIILKKGKHYKWFPDGQLNISYNCIDLINQTQTIIPTWHDSPDL